MTIKVAGNNSVLKSIVSTNKFPRTSSNYVTNEGGSAYILSDLEVFKTRSIELFFMGRSVL